MAQHEPAPPPARVVVPRRNTVVVGIRPTIRKQEVKSILARLRDPGRGADGGWKGRFRENSERMRSGDLASVAGVLHSLAGVAREGALSFREYEEGLRAAGFSDIDITPTHEPARGMHSAIVKATKP